MSIGTKRWLYPVLAFVGILVVFGVFGGIKACSVMGMLKAYANAKQPAVAVSATAAKPMQWRPRTQAIGSIAAVNGVDVSSELAGKVTAITFHSGDKVGQGQLLVQLDDSQEQALLKQYEAQEKLNENNYRRALSLSKKNLNSKQDLDNARTQYEMSQAQVAQEKAVIAKKAIRAPFAGVVGIRQVNLGQYLNAGTTVVNLEQLDPLFVNFTLPQADIGHLHVKQAVELTVDGYPGKRFSGTLTAINPAVDNQSRMLQAQATVPNPDHDLRPGMFANVAVLGDQTESVIAVPSTAVTYTLYGDSVYVLEKKDKAPVGTTVSATAKASETASGAKNGGPVEYTAKQVFVKVGNTHDGMVAVTGIKPGELVVTAGQIKLHPGATAVINNSVDLSKVPELTP